MQDTPAENPPSAPAPKGWRRARPRRDRSLLGDFPTPAEKVSYFASLFFLSLTFVTFFVAPIAIHVMADIGWIRWAFNFKTTELILLPFGLAFLLLGFCLNPREWRERKHTDGDATPANGH